MTTPNYRADGGNDTNRRQGVQSQDVRGIVSILTGLCVLFSSAFCACVAVAQPQSTAGAHVCCRQDQNCPAKPGHPHDPARDCPHCDGSAVTAAPQQTQDLQHVMTLLPAPDFDVAIDAAITSPVAPPHRAHSLAPAPPPAPTLLGLHCALTL